MSNESVESVVEQVRQHDQEAARLIYERFLPRVLRLAESRIGAALGRRVAAEDIAQAALRSLLSWCGWNNDQVHEIQTWDDLWGVVAKITVRKCLKERRKHSQEMRDSGREVPLPPDIPDGPSPEDRIILTDLVDNLLLPLSDRKRDALRRMLDGSETMQEIATQTLLSQTTLFRIKRELREQLQKYYDETKD